MTQRLHKCRCVYCAIQFCFVMLFFLFLNVSSHWINPTTQQQTFIEFHLYNGSMLVPFLDHSRWSKISPKESKIQSNSAICHVVLCFVAFDRWPKAIYLSIRNDHAEQQVQISRQKLTHKVSVFLVFLSRLSDIHI